MWSPSNCRDNIYERSVEYPVQHLTYWQQLKYLSLNSLERRRERYIIMYVWSILERHATNFDLPGNCGINCTCTYVEEGILFLELVIRPHQQFKVQTIRYESFAVRGPMLFNTWPSEVRNMTNCSSESFKQALDTFLKTTSFSKLYLMSLRHLDTPT